MTTIDPPSADDADLGALLRRALRDEAPPAAARDRAIALHDPTRRRLRQAGAALRRLVAVLVAAPPAPFEPAFGVRGGAPAVQHWLFRADECEIDLRIAARGERWSVSGQLFGAPAAQRVLLAGQGGEIGVTLGPTNEFAFGDLPAGRYALTVKAGALDIVIPQIDVGGADSAG